MHDASGGVLPDASITVTEVVNNVTTALRKDSQGNYVATSFKIVTYGPTVETPWFKTRVGSISESANDLNSNDNTGTVLETNVDAIRYTLDQQEEI